MGVRYISYDNIIQFYNMMFFCNLKIETPSQSESQGESQGGGRRLPGRSPWRALPGAATVYHACVRRYWWLCLMEIFNVQGQGIYCRYCYKTTLFWWSWKRENSPGFSRSSNVLKLRLPAMSLIPWLQKHNFWRHFKNPSVPSRESWTEIDEVTQKG